jgi:hypothetical protein
MDSCVAYTTRVSSKKECDMRFRDARNLTHHDDVLVRVSPGKWVEGYVVGAPIVDDGGVFVDVGFYHSTEILRKIWHINIK